MQRTSNPSSGFTLLEMAISAAIGAVLIAAAAQLYSRALTISSATTQRAQLQQDFRTAANLMQRDISMAGAGALGEIGLATSAVALPSGGAGTLVPDYPCTALTTCNYINSLPVAYPTITSVPYLYSIIPGYDLGITVNAAQGATDIITVIAADPNIQLNCYTGTLNAAATEATFLLPTGPPWPSTCVLPTTLAAPEPLNAAVPIGLQTGDMILFGSNAIGVVTGAVGTCAVPLGDSACYTVPFAALADPGHINQPAATHGSLSQYASSITPSAVRLQMVTYYLAINPTTSLPTLMRIQNGQAPAPVAENVIYLKFTYDVINNGTIATNQATLPAGTTPSMITKVNIAHMTMRSQAIDKLSRSTLSQNAGYEGIDLQTSIAARNLTSGQEYPIACSTPPCY
jgi:prepilin-type N-terminal cleavage/methylation domain-containing protein